MIVILLTLSLVNTIAVPFDFSTTGAVRYLAQFGYLPTANQQKEGIISEILLREAIADFQTFAGINVTGSLNKETAILMAMPRCGVKDRGTSENRSKRYVLQGSRWRLRRLTYKISKYPKALKRTAVDEAITKAFSVWSNNTDLTFSQRNSGQVHIDVRFETGNHGDGDSFDGPGGTLAHAYFPVYGGDAHFDDAEHWTTNSFRGTNLLQVAAHEFGHSLGLSHSDVSSALMAPFYRGYDSTFLLDKDDISGIQALYGPKVGQREVTADSSTVYSSQSSSEDASIVLCSNPKIDTIFNTQDGQTFVFQGEYVWRLNPTGVDNGFPKSINSIWKELPISIDAAFTYKNGKTYFFKGTKYWRYVGHELDGEYPKDISDGFTGIPDDIDAASVWTGNGKIYFYKGTKFWRFDPSQKPPVKDEYPKPISNWVGIPNNIDASLTFHGFTYFFKGAGYFRFNDRTFSVDIASPPFPRATAYWWFGCESVTRGTLNDQD